jgi:hypothetical protein
MIGVTRRPGAKRGRLALAVLAVCLLTAAIAASSTTSSSSGLGPLSLYALPGSERVHFEARVVERLRAGSYTYLLVERATGRRSWVVTLSTSAGAEPATQTVKITAMGYASHFHSKRLARQFDGLYFAVVRPA